MNNEELNHLAICEQAMKQARWAIAIQLRRWRDGDSVSAVSKLQNAYDSLADLVGDAKIEEPSNPVLKSCNSLEPQAPAMLEALKALLADPYLADPINKDRMAKARAILAAVEGKV